MILNFSCQELDSDSLTHDSTHLSFFDSRMSVRRSSRISATVDGNTSASESEPTVRRRATTPRRSSAAPKDKFGEIVVAPDSISPIPKPTSARALLSSSGSSTHAADTTAAGAPAATSAAAKPEGEATWRKVFRRFWTSLAMFLAFCGIIHLGQPATILLVIIIQFMMYREIVHLAYTHLLTESDRVHIPLFRTQNWFWFFVTVFFTYGRVLRGFLGIEIPYHMFLSFTFLVVGFVGFVISLRQGMYRRQFGMFAWVLLAIVFVVLQSTVLMYNMVQGLFWFVLPAILIISNDSWAYVWGMLVGRTPLIQLSPRKTWEGFIGAFISTCLTGFFVARVMTLFPILTCPVSTLSFTHPVCASDVVFRLQPFAVNVPAYGTVIFQVAPAQWHGLVMAIFASAIAPFGGFFASGFKRAFKIKDFGDLIPGHGGLTDRMDCQLLMGLFVYVYYWSFVNPSEAAGAAVAVTADSVLELALKLNSSAQAKVYAELGRVLAAAGKSATTAAAAAVRG